MLVQWALRVFLLIVLAVMVFPLFMLTANSLMGRQELLETCGAVLADYGESAKLRVFPMYPTLRAYVRLLLDSPEYFTAFWNSMIQTILVLAGQLLAAVPAAWAFAQFRFPGKKVLWFLYMLLMILPFQVTMLSSYLILNKLELLNTHWSIILPAIFNTFPVFVTYGGFRTIPKALIEAARIDGAGECYIFFKIGLGIGRSGILSALVLGFLEYWNMIEQPFAFLEDKFLWPLSLYLPEIDWTQAGFAFAASVVMLIPAIFVFVMGQDYLEQGIIYSGLKA